MGLSGALVLRGGYLEWLTFVNAATREAIQHPKTHTDANATELQ